MNLDQDHLRRAYEIVKLCQAVGCNVKYLDNLNYGERKNFDDLVELYKKYSVDNINTVFCPFVDDEAMIKSKSNQTMNIFFPKYKNQFTQYNDLIVLIDSPDWKNIGGSAYNHKDKILRKIIIGSSSINSVPIVNHEEVHALVYSNMNMRGSNFFYLETLPMSIEMITGMELDNRFDSNENLLATDCVRLTSIISSISNLFDINKYDIAHHEPVKLLNYERYQNMISTACANVLFKRYFEDPQRMIISLEKLLGQLITMEQFLDYYDASLSSSEILPLATHQLNKCKKIDLIH